LRRDGLCELFTYNVGPIFNYRAQHLEPFAEALFGGAHSNTYQNPEKACQAACTTSNNPSNSAFDFVLRGVLDIPLSRSIAIRPAQVDFVLARFCQRQSEAEQPPLPGWSRFSVLVEPQAFEGGKKKEGGGTASQDNRAARGLQSPGFLSFPRRSVEI